MIYRLISVVNGNKITIKYHNFNVATNKLVKLNSGKLYYGKTLVAEL